MKSPPAVRTRSRRTDTGFTLIELVIAIVLSGMIAGVVVTAMITSLRVARSTTDAVADSADTGLISTFLVRDAQSSGGIDPTTGRPNPSLGISADPAAPDWAGCTQYIPGVFLPDGSPKPAAFIVRFSWLDAVSASAVVVTYALVPDPLDGTKPQLIRRLCKNGVSADLVLGRHLTSAVISCLTGAQTNTTCVGQPTSVSLSVNGSSIVNAAGEPTPYSATLTASFRSAASQLAISGPTALPPGQVGVAYQAMAIAPGATPNLITAGSNAPATWVATGLPSGLSISSSTGTISGTPTVAGGPFSIIITATDAATTPTTNYSTSASKTYSITIAAVLGGQGPASLPVGQAGVLYTSTQMTRTGGTGPYTWTQTGLPAGMSISSDGSGLISGTPAVSGTFTVNVTVTDAMTATITKSYVLTINAVLAISTVSLPNGQVGVAYSTTVASTGGTAPKTWSATGLPAGLAINASTGTISGTPTAATTATVVVTVTDAMTGTANRTYTVVINAALAVATATLPNGQVGVAYSSTVAPTGGTAPYAWSATGLPTGLTISAAGLVSGTPTVAGPFSAIVTVTDAIPTSANRTFAITIAAAAVTCPGTVVGWKAEYYSNVALTGAPVLCRDDANPINLDWGSGSPDPTVPVDNFSVRWTRTQAFAAGYYTFTLGSDDGGRLYIDGVRVVDSWVDRSYATSPPYSVFVGDGIHTIVMEFYENGGLARATLNWVASTPPSCSTAATGWLGQYFSNVSLTGPPAACRDDADPLNFNWGTGAPLSGMPADNFSVRWTRTPTFTAGTYKFSLGTDDGGRLYIDGVLQGPPIDQWVVQNYPTPQPSIAKTLTAGPHALVVEFFTQTGTAQATLVVAPVSPPTTPVLTFSAFTNSYWSGAGSTVVFYRPGIPGSFATTAAATDAAYGIASYAFPALGTNWTSTPGALGVNTYSWTGTPAVPGLQNVTATNNAGVTSATSPFTPTADSTAPTAGTVTYPNGTQATTSVSVSFTTGTDAGSGVGTRLLQRQSATLTGITCGAYGAFATVTNGTNPTSPVADTVTLGNCYKYQYVVSDNVGNLNTAVGASVVKVRTSYYDTVNSTGGLLSYWRLGEPTVIVSSDTFTGATGATLQGHTGEIGATWTKHAISTTDAVITANDRIRKNGSNTSGALYYSSAAPASADYTVAADVYVASRENDDRVGIVGRLNPASSSGTFYWAYYDRSSRRWVLVRQVNGAKTTLGQTSTQSLTAGTTYRLELKMTGSTIELLVDGVQELSASDTSITATGRAGIVVGYGSNMTNTDLLGMHLDNFSVTSPNVPIVDNEGVNTGTYVNKPTLGVAGALTVSGDTDTAVQFDGISDYGSVARQISSDFSIEFWFNSTAGGIGTSSQWWAGAGLVDAEVGGGLNDFGVSLRSDGRVVAGVGAGSDVSIVSTPATSYKDGNWHHVVFTRSMASGALRLYIDGAAAGSATGGTTTLTGPSFINFGRIQSGGNYFAGSLDEIAIYTSVLPLATVTAHYNAA